MVTNVTILLIFITLTTVAAQTFQYSRGWTNGKRDGQKRNEDDSIRLEKILSPCQMHKLKYLLDGKPMTEKLLLPCDYIEDDSDEPKRHKIGLARDSLYDALQ